MSIYPEKTIRAVLDKLEAGPLLKLINYRTDTIQITGGTVKCFCPVHKEQVFRTLIITTKDKSYRCSYSLCPGNKGGDLISLFALSRGLEYDEGLVTLVKELNIDIELPTTQEFIDKTVEVAENYLELAALDEAESGFSKVAEIQPGNIAAHKGLLEIHTARKNEEKIIQELKKLISLLTAARKYDDALVFATMLVEKTPESKEAHYLMVECHEGLEDFSSALGEYMNLADLHEMDGEFDKALEVYHKIESLGLDLIDVYPHIINVLVASNRTEDAIAETIKRATAFHQTREYEKTLECYRYILELDTSRHDIRKQYIQLALEVGMTPDRVDECLRIVDEMLEQHAVGDAIEALHALSAALPADVGILGKLIAVYLEQGRDGEAETLELRLSDILESEGNLEGALEPLHSIISRNPASTEALFRTAGINTARGEPGLAVEAFLSIIKIHKDKGEYLNAIGAYDHLMQVAPDEVPFREQQIDLYIEAGLKEDAFNRCLQLLEYLESKKQNEQLITKFRFALKLKPQEVSLIIRLADHLLRMKYINEARDEYFHAYEVLRKGGKPDLAAKQLLRCLDINPDDRKALQALGETLVEAGDPKRAFQYLRKLADSYLQEENYEEAQKVLRQLLAIQPDDINILTLLVNAYSKLGYENEVVETYETMNSLYLQKEAFNKVIEICREILTLRPDNVSAHQQLISVYERTNRQADAIQLLLGLADIHSRSGNLAQEEECYDTILRKDNANVEARKRHVFLLLKLSRKQAAYKEARILSDQYTARNQTPLAVALYSSLLESDPDELPLNLHLLELQKKTGNNDDITKQIQRIIQIYLQRDQKPIAAEYYGELIRYAPDNTGFRKALVDLLIDLDHIDEALVQTIQLADCHVLREEFQNAENAYEDLLVLLPESQEIHRKLIALNRLRGTLDKAVHLIFNLADIQGKEGDSEEAISTLREVFEFDALNTETCRRIIVLQKNLGRDDDAVESHLALFDILQNTGSIEDGVSVLREAIQIKPEDTSLRKKLSGVLTQLGQNPEAVKELMAVCDIHAKAEKYKEVQATIDDILAIDPNNLRARKRRAETYALMGDDKKALAEFLRLSTDLDSGSISAPAAASAAHDAQAMGELPIVDDYTFESFVVGAHNNFAYATAMAVAKAPAQNYNPLFLCSDVGLGKTHLIHAIANYLRQHNPEMRILYTNSEEFTTRLIDAIQNNTITQFRASHKNVDLLLLDDVQFLAGKERAQEEFFHLFNTLFQARKQIVITSDRPPKDIAHLEKRLKSRFGAGIIVDIQPPDMVTRAAILKRERDHMPDVQVSDQIINIIAERVETNIRDLKGAFNQIIARQRIANQPITDDMALRILESLFEKVS